MHPPSPFVSTHPTSLLCIFLPSSHASPFSCQCIPLPLHPSCITFFSATPPCLPFPHQFSLPLPFFISITSLFPLFLLFFLIYTMYWCFHLSIMSRRACHCKRDHLFSNIVFLCYSTIQYKYHHSTKLYWKMSWICWCQYCYESAAWVTMPAATNEWYYFWYSLVLRW